MLKEIRLLFNRQGWSVMLKNGAVFLGYRPSCPCGLAQNARPWAELLYFPIWTPWVMNSICLFPSTDHHY